MNPTAQDKIEKFKRILEETTSKKNLDAKYADQDIKKDGDTFIRILPNKDLNRDFFVKSGFHRINGEYVNCPKETKKERCPICEYVSKLYKSDNIADLEVAKELKKTRRYYYNIIVRGTEEKGVRILTSGIKLFEKIIGACANPEVGDITDIGDGYDFKINKRQKDGYANYDMSDAVRKSSPLTTDPAKSKAWLDSQYDLEKEIKLLSYDELKKMLLEAIERPQDNAKMERVEKKVESVEQKTVKAPPVPEMVEEDNIDDEIETFRKNLENIKTEGKG